MRFVLALLLMVPGYATIGKAGSFYTRHITMRLDGQKKTSYEVGIIQLPLTGSYQVERISYKEGNVFDNVEYYPEEIQTSYGLTRLLCKNGAGEDIVFESWPVNPFAIGSNDDHVLSGWVPKYLIPTSHTRDTPLTAFLDVMSDASWSKGPSYAALLVLSATHHDSDASYDAGGTRINLAACTLRFLTEAEQTHQPRGRLVSADGTALFGSFPLKQQTMANLPDATRLLGAEEAEDAKEAALFTMRDGKGANSSSSLASSDECIPIPDNINGLGAFNFLEVATQAGIPGLDKMIEMVLDPILKPVIGIVGGIIGTGLANLVKHNGGQQMDTALDEMITGQLTNSLVPQLSKVMVNPLIETLAAEVPTQIAQSLTGFVSEQLTERLSNSLTKSVTKSLAPLLNNDISEATVPEIAKHITFSLTHILSRSLSHSVVPAVSHVLTHSPLQDYYCYYCFHHKTYCDYCQSEPAQLYYSMHYTTFYSQYFSDYFASYYAMEAGTEQA